MARAHWTWGWDADTDLELLGHSLSSAATHFASLDDFYPWQEARPVDLKQLLLHNEHAQLISPYCICARSCCLVFVELPSVDSYTNPGMLFYETQRHRARRVFCVPFNRAGRLAQALAPRVDFGKLLVVFNTGRCGSNLLSAALAEFHGICSISEPDVFAPLYVPLPAEADVGSRREEAPQLVWAAAVMLLLWAQSATPGFRLLAVKARSRLAGDMSSALRALPGARAVMMYRRFLPTIASMNVAFRPRFSKHWFMAAAVALGLDPWLYAAFWLLGSHEWLELVGMPVVAGARPPVPPHVVWRCGHLAVHAVKVINTLEQARRAHEAGLLSFCITYEALLQHRGAYLRRILAAACGPQPPANGAGREVGADFSLRSGDALERVFSVDQHQGRLSSCSGGPLMWRVLSKEGKCTHGLTPTQTSRVEALRRWLQPGRRDADELLPGTLLPM